MDKKSFLKFFKDSDEYMLTSLWNDIELVLAIDSPIFTKEFYPPIIWSYLEKNNINGLKFIAKGLNQDSEKKIIMIAPKDYDTSIFTFPLVYFKIDGENKFRELLHKDFLGTIMSLGIKREIMGDLIVKNNICFGVITEEKYGIINEDITKIGNVPVKFYKVTEEDIPKTSFSEENLLLSSLRLDSFVSGVTNLSRQKSVDEIESGNVLLNYNVEKDKSREIKEGDIITIKKVGKFRFCDIKGESKKNKIRINVKKFI